MFLEGLTIDHTKAGVSRLKIRVAFVQDYSNCSYFLSWVSGNVICKQLPVHGRQDLDGCFSPFCSLCIWALKLLVRYRKEFTLR